MGRNTQNTQPHTHTKYLVGAWARPATAPELQWCRFDQLRPRHPRRLQQLQHQRQRQHHRRVVEANVVTRSSLGQSDNSGRDCENFGTVRIGTCELFSLSPLRLDLACLQRQGGLGGKNKAFFQKDDIEVCKLRLKRRNIPWAQNGIPAPESK